LIKTTIQLTYELEIEWRKTW